MNYKRTLKTRLLFAICCIVIGLGLVLLPFFGITKQEVITAFGIVYILSGIVRVIQYFKITKDEKKLYACEIAEKDERTIMILNKARSLAFTIYIILAGFAVILLYLADMQPQAQTTAYSICALTVIYLFCYHIIKRKY